MFGQNGDLPVLPAPFGAVVGLLERAPDSQDECSALLALKVTRQTFRIKINNKKRKRKENRHDFESNCNTKKWSYNKISIWSAQQLLYAKS